MFFVATRIADRWSPGSGYLSSTRIRKIAFPILYFTFHRDEWSDSWTSRNLTKPNRNLGTQYTAFLNVTYKT